MGYLGNAFALLPRYRDADAVLSCGDSLLLPLLGKPLVRIRRGLSTNPLHVLIVRVTDYPCC